MKKTIKNQTLIGERALFQSNGITVVDCRFEDGESPIKESRGVDVEGSTFGWKYPLWYSSDITVKDTVWEPMARAGVWYTNNIVVENSIIHAPKNFRRCRNITLKNVEFTDAQETMWNCADVHAESIHVKGDYFAMNGENMVIDNMVLDGNYGFDGAKNVEIRRSKLLTKDAFWNSENVTVYDSYISGEYLGWNAKNLTLINCTIESLQGLCYVDHLVMRDCRLTNTTLAFEYSTVDAEIIGDIESVLNPSGGRIVCDEIKELTMDADKIDPQKTKIVQRNQCNGDIPYCPCQKALAIA